MRQAILILGALAAAIGLAACGGGSGGALSFDPVAKAAEKTIHSNGEKFTLTADVEADGKSVEMIGGGVADRTSADLTLTTKGFSPNSVVLHEVGVEEHGSPVLFLSSPQFKGQVPGDKKWIRLDLGKAWAKRYGMNLSQMTWGQNPTDSLKLLRSKGLSPQKVGVETIDGHPTQRYHVDVDVAKAMKNAGLSDAGLRTLKDELGSMKTFPVDVWVDKAGYVRQERLSFTVSGAKMRMTIKMFDFGTAVSIKAPPKDDTVDMTSVALSGG